MFEHTMSSSNLQGTQEIMHKSESNINAVQEKGIQTNVKKAKRHRNQRHTPLDFAISFIGQFIF